MISKDSVERMTLSQKFKWYATVYAVQSGSQLSMFRSGWEVIFLHRNRIELFLMMKLIVFLTTCPEEKISLWYLLSNTLFFHVAYSRNYWYKLLPPQYYCCFVAHIYLAKKLCCCAQTSNPSRTQRKWEWLGWAGVNFFSTSSDCDLD